MMSGYHEPAEPMRERSHPGDRRYRGVATMKPIMRDPETAGRPLLASRAPIVAMLATGTAHAEHFDVDLWLDRGQEAVYEPGDPIQIGVRASDDAYVLVYEIDAEGYLHLLFPHGPSSTFI